jgi:hypothetical protein
MRSTGGTQYLQDVLIEAAALVRRAGEKKWAEWLDQDRILVSCGDLEGLDHLLKAFGGMGSFSDLVILPSNGHTIAESEVDSVNSALDAYRTKIYELASYRQQQRGLAPRS